MKKNTLKVLITSCFLILFGNIHGQLLNDMTGADITKSSGSGTISLPHIIPSSPKASSITRYGEYPVSLYTGLVDISVPVYTIDAGWIKVPIEFKYHASGIKYDDVSLEVGLGWTLIAGGTINYTARGSIDGTYGPFIKKVSEIDPKSVCAGSSYDDNIMLGYVVIGNQLYPTINQGRDGEFDMFTYSFLDHNGQFYFPTNYYNACFIPQKPLKIINRSNTAISLFDEQGISYFFERFESDATNRNISYYMTKIISANKTDTISFSYTKYSPTIENAVSRPYINSSFIFREYFPKHIDLGSFGYSEYSYDGNLTAQMYYPPRLNNIKFRGGSVTFEYYGSSAASRDLRTIKVYNTTSTNPLQTILLTKSAFANKMGNRLDKVTFNNQQGDSYSYQFGYNGNPGVNPTGIDYWGYYNGSSISSGRYTPNFIIQALLYPNGYQIQGMNRNANETAMQGGILNKVTYPTKGYTLFSYETHRAWNKAYGGLRIKELSNYNSDGTLLEKKWYKYGTNESGEGRAAAFPQEQDFCVYTRTLREYTREPHAPSLGHVIDTRQYLSFPRKSYFTSGSSVVYSTVTEYTGDGAKTVYQFEDSPDELVMSYFNYRTGAAEIASRSYVWKCGMLKSKTSYKKINNTYSVIYSLNNGYKEINTSEYQNLRVLPYILPEVSDNKHFLECFNNDGYYQKYFEQFRGNSPYDYFNYYITTGDMVLTSSTETSDGVSKQTRYNNYSSYGIPSETEYTQSDGKKILILNKYPYDFPTNTTYKNMTDENIISPVIESCTSVGGTSVSAEKVNYKEWEIGKFMPENIQKGINLSNPESRIIYHKYNAKGNPVYLSKDNADKVVYLWGYNYQYPIAEIRGTTYNEVKAALGYNDSQIESLATQANPDVNGSAIGGKLRTYFKDKPTLITTYTYNPLIGVSSITDPSGIVTTYEYDSFGRLKNTRDTNKKTIEEYKYNYKNQ